MNDRDRRPIGEIPTTSLWSVPEAEPCCPRQLGRYRIASTIGMGGYAEVFLAHDEELDRQVAVKIPRRDRFRNEAELRAFVDEARMVARLQHPGIVNVFDVGWHEGTPFIVLEYIRGRTLAHLMKHESVSCTFAARIVAAIAEALLHAHDQGFVHRDIKPQNILLDTDDRPHIADFGLAIHQYRELSGIGDEIAGTRSFMSPEQVRGENHRIDGRTDIWALGVVFYQMLTTQMPFTGTSEHEIFQNILYTGPIPPRELDVNIPAELERICLRCLSRLMSERYRRAADLVDDLSEWLRLSDIGSSSSLKRKVGKIESPEARVVPRGLRSFDEEDVDFFLRLMPGPRDRDGLPSSIGFWKSRIEEVEAEKTFKLGLLYGPSGCGKSSLVKAGLSPRIDHSVAQLHIDASRRETEALLSGVLRKKFPNLPPNIPLDEAVRQLRERRELRQGRKVLIVLDQFEQWLHTWQDGADAELVRALRQCDGENVQCLLLARDDYWLLVARFMRCVEVTIVEHVNAMLVDSFDLEHAKRVLREFGVAYGRLPASLADQSTEQSAFIQEAAQELGQENRLYPVRLAVFVEMVKDRAWTPQTLREMGGTEGIGVAYLENSIGARASSARRTHEHAARRVLSALLPPTGQINGGARRRCELLEISQCTQTDFGDLMQLLDGELRLMTPVILAGEQTDGQGEDSAASRQEVTYQLTHDFLVPSIRQWLERNMRETRRGRALLLLQDQTELWSTRPSARSLPSFTEWLGIRLCTKQHEWTLPQRRMMHVAGRRIARRAIIASVILLALVSAGWSLNRVAKQRRGQDAAAQLASKLQDVDITEVPQVVAQMAPYRDWVNPLLRKTVGDLTQTERRRIRAAIALLPVDGSNLDWLIDRLINEESSPLDFRVLRAALLPHAKTVVPKLHSALADETLSSRKRLRIVCALVGLEHTHEKLIGLGPEIASSLIHEPAADSTVWIDLLRPSSEWLLQPLIEALDDSLTLEQARIGTLAVFEFDGELANRLVDVLVAANASSYRAVIELLRRNPKVSQQLVQERFAVLNEQEPNEPLSDGQTRAIANLMLACFELGDSSLLSRGARVQDDPRVRTALILGMTPEQMDLGVLLNVIFEPQHDQSLRNAAMFAAWHRPELGEPFNENLRTRLTDHLLATYQTVPDPEAHSIAGLLLRKLGVDLSETDRKLTSSQPLDSRRWYVNKAGQTMIVLNPRETHIGNYRPPDELTYTFAMSSTEVTYEQMRNSLPYFTQNTSFQSGAGKVPAAGVLAVLAAKYCNRLSLAEGLGNDELCYPTETELTVANCFPLPDFRKRTGYRLPTSSEWEFACRSGSKTDYFFGNDARLMQFYGWHANMGGWRMHPVGDLLPNAFGMFDMYGNVSEICFSDHSNSRFSLRGQSASKPADTMKSDIEIELGQKTVAILTGFRVVRSMKD